MVTNSPNGSFRCIFASINAICDFASLFDLYFAVWFEKMQTKMHRVNLSLSLCVQLHFVPRNIALPIMECKDPNRSQTHQNAVHVLVSSVRLNCLFLCGLVDVWQRTYKHFVRLRWSAVPFILE